VAAGLTVSVGVVGTVAVVNRTGEPEEPARIAAPVVSTAPEAPAPSPVEPVVAEEVVAEPVLEEPVVDVPLEVAPAEPRVENVVDVEDAVDEVVRVPVVVPAAQVPVVPVVQVPVVEEPPVERVLLSTAVDVPAGWEVPTGSLTVEVPLPEPVTVTGEVSSPEAGRVEVGLTLSPGARHVVTDPPAESVADVAAAVDRVARHRLP
jgi:hypothetical protein